MMIIILSADKQDFINAYEALLEAVNYIMSYPDYEMDTAGGLVADDLVHFPYLREHYDNVYSIKEFPIFSKNKKSSL